jgi:hypothetical protein
VTIADLLPGMAFSPDRFGHCDAQFNRTHPIGAS